MTRLHTWQQLHSTGPFPVRLSRAALRVLPAAVEAALSDRTICPRWRSWSVQASAA